MQKKGYKQIIKKFKKDMSNEQQKKEVKKNQQTKPIQPELLIFQNNKRYK